MKDNKLSMKVYPKTVYTDVVGMPDPMLLGVTIHYYNHSASNLYIKIFGTGPSPWSSNSVELGLLNSGEHAYENLDNFLSRTTPASETTEQVTLTLKGYSDAGYSDLVYIFARNVTIIFLKSDDGSWTLNEDDDFDDGTSMGWACKTLTGDQSQTLTCAIATDYVLSVPNSFKIESRIINVSSPWFIACYLKYWEFKEGSNLLLHLGESETDHGGWGVNGNGIPEERWIRIVVPLPRNTTTEIQIIQDAMARYNTQTNHRRGLFCAYKTFTTPDKNYVYAIVNIRGNAKVLTPAETGSNYWYMHYMWIEDFKIISKD